MVRTALLSIAILALVGCNTKSKLLGSWSGSLSGASVRLTFGADGRFESLLAAERNGGIKTNGTYKVDGNSVTLHPETITNSAGTLPADQSSLGRAMRYSITWRGEKSMKMANMRDSMELTKE